MSRPLRIEFEDALCHDPLVLATRRANWSMLMRHLKAVRHGGTPD